MSKSKTWLVVMVVLALAQVGLTFWVRHNAWWDGWESGYRRNHCDQEQTRSGVSSPYCDDIDEWGRKR